MSKPPMMDETVETVPSVNSPKKQRHIEIRVRMTAWFLVKLMMVSVR